MPVGSRGMSWMNVARLAQTSRVVEPNCLSTSTLCFIRMRVLGTSRGLESPEPSQVPQPKFACDPDSDASDSTEITKLISGQMQVGDHCDQCDQFVGLVKPGSVEGIPCEWQPDKLSQMATNTWSWENADRCVSVILRNLPSNYTQDMFLYDLMSSGFQGCFDLLYLPFCHRHGNFGFAVVNFIHSEHAIQFYCYFHRRTVLAWGRTGKEGLLVHPAPRQGYAANYDSIVGVGTGEPPLCRTVLPKAKASHNQGSTGQ